MSPWLSQICDVQPKYSKIVYTQLQKKVYTLSFGRTHERVWGIAHWSSTPNKTEFVKKFLVVPKFWIKVWGYALYQPVNTKVNGRNRFLWTFLHNIPANFPLELWNHLEFIHKLWLHCQGTLIGCPSKLLGSSSSYILSTHWETKCILFFWSRVYMHYLILFLIQLFCSAEAGSWELSQKLCRCKALHNLSTLTGLHSLLQERTRVKFPHRIRFIFEFQFIFNYL